jgi:hypothetical protein
MLKSLPAQLAATILIAGFCKWLVAYKIGYPGVYIVAAVFAVIWILIATHGRRMLARLRTRRPAER